MTTHIPYYKTKLTGGFWKLKQDLNTAHTIPAVYERFKETGRIITLDFETPWPQGQEPHIYWLSDVVKWLEGAADTLAIGQGDNELREKCAWIVEQIAKYQAEDGYFNNHFQRVAPEKRWTDWNLHELYCAGHLFEAAVAWKEATGEDTLLNVSSKFVDYIERVFVTEKSAAFQTPGHEEIELALIKLHAATGDEKYLRLARYFVDTRGTPGTIPNVKAVQAHKPLREQTEAEGHAVRAGYIYSAMADLARIDGDESLAKACRALFANISTRRMSITGGIGSSAAKGEAFTFDYDLPNINTYNETCAAISLAMFARRMSALEPDSRYGDVAELCLYNGILAGLSLDGEKFFYECPLEIHPRLKERNERFPITQRVAVFSCSCCPPNLNRVLGSITDYLYTKDADTLYIHHFMDSETAFDWNGKAVSVKQVTDYPWDDHVAFVFKGMAGRRIAVRRPGWSDNCSLTAKTKLTNGYYYFNITSDEETIQYDMNVEVKLMSAHTNVWEDIGRAAVQRGPVVYCLEAIDNGDNLRALAVTPDAKFSLKPDDRLGLCLETAGWRVKVPADGKLYAPYNEQWAEQTLRFIPYYAFANRGESEMSVFVRVK
ncbi:MAG: glycoside hydrolase family 127 protein [Oscillospiraceae bacterium]|jgi:DUF1680 family protein|nr:glycoside hydrolase family 127 protein [Oscillospiraceae bacterium]